MTGCAFIYDSAYARYRFTENHPFNPLRLEATHDLIRQLGWLSDAEWVRPEPASLADLSLAHSPHYIDLVQRLSTIGRPTAGIERLGLGTDDNPVFAGMHEASALAVGGTLKASALVVNGTVRRAVNLAGGLHHAGFGHASGFCIYNDIVVAIRWIRQQTGWRVLYVDTDAHHGDGVQDAFYEDPEVFCISLHESGRFLFPGSGAVDEIGRGRGQGTTINIPLMPASDDSSCLEAFEAVVPAVLDQFKPQILISQHGCDGHYWDPLADLCVTTRFYDQVARLLSRWVDQYAEGRWIATGGGGYQILRVVPRAWAILWARLSERPLSPEIALPSEWLTRWQPESPTLLPSALFDVAEQFMPLKDRRQMIEANRHTVAELARLLPDFNFGQRVDNMGPRGKEEP